MYLGRVIGNLHATIKNEGLQGQRFLLVQPVNAKEEATGNSLICLDWAGAREGDLIWWVRGREASFPLFPEGVPADATIVAIVDYLDLQPAAAVTPFPTTKPSSTESGPEARGDSPC